MWPANLLFQEIIKNFDLPHVALISVFQPHFHTTRVKYSSPEFSSQLHSGQKPANVESRPHLPFFLVLPPKFEDQIWVMNWLVPVFCHSPIPWTFSVDIYRTKVTFPKKLEKWKKYENKFYNSRKNTVNFSRQRLVANFCKSFRWSPSHHFSWSRLHPLAALLSSEYYRLKVGFKQF